MNNFGKRPAAPPCTYTTPVSTKIVGINGGLGAFDLTPEQCNKTLGIDSFMQVDEHNIGFPKSCLKKRMQTSNSTMIPSLTTIPTNTTTKLKSKSTTLKAKLKAQQQQQQLSSTFNPSQSFLLHHGDDNYNNKVITKGTLATVEKKKKVSFAPGTIMVDRESKPYNRMLPKPRPPLMPDLFSGFTIPEFDQMFQSSPQQSSTISSPFNNRSVVAKATNNTKNSALLYKNDYTKFTLARKVPEHPLHTDVDRLPTRVKRLFENIENLQVAHVTYNSLPSTDEVREKFLLDQVIRRQIVSLEISLSEGLVQFAKDVIDTMYEATHFISSLFYQDFYQPDGSHTILPILMNNKSDEYINKLAPVVYALNRCIMFRSILEVVPSTAIRARQLLEEIENKNSIKWVNNSMMRKDYTKILLNFHLIDKHDIVTKFPHSNSLKQQPGNKFSNGGPKFLGNSNIRNSSNGINIHNSNSNNASHSSTTSSSSNNLPQPPKKIKKKNTTTTNTGKRLKEKKKDKMKDLMTMMANSGGVSPLFSQSVSSNFSPTEKGDVSMM